MDTLVDVGSLSSEMGTYIAAQAPLLFLSVFLAKKLQMNDIWSGGDVLFSTIFYPVLAGYAVVAASSTCDTVDSRWRLVTPETKVFLMLYCSRTLIHAFAQPFMQMSTSHLCMMTVHHILSLTCFGAGLVTNNMHFYGCLAGCSEISTIFLNNLALFKDVAVRGKPIKDYIPVWLFTLNGASLWLSFLVCRMIIFPTWLYLWASDVASSPETTWNRSIFIEKHIYPLVIVFLFLLSSYWFVLITKGLLKNIGLLSGESVEEDHGKSKNGNRKEQPRNETRANNDLEENLLEKDR
eukprot:TRINITY_DN11568_c1_g1_i1.p1 TRINITY_DN11568_c1_g1~~TRINITY_DN11568_c1_g1_i1.p1  ORF type:complete len:294 (-),score=35.69 TRINITY_DN11568_c1_g1_i1:31-912(-)